jgi:hypothetical protein
MVMQAGGLGMMGETGGTSVLFFGADGDGNVAAEDLCRHCPVDRALPPTRADPDDQPSLIRPAHGVSTARHLPWLVSNILTGPPKVIAPWISRIFTGIGRTETFVAGGNRRLNWVVSVIPKTLLRHVPLRFDSVWKFGKGAAMLAWIQIWIRFRTVILAAVACGMVLLPAPAAHANMTPAKAEASHMMSAQNSHGHGIQTQQAKTGIDISADTDSHHDGQCCSGTCVSMALIESVASSARARIGLVRNTASMQLASADAPEFLRPPLS